MKPSAVQKHMGKQRDKGGVARGHTPCAKKRFAEFAVVKRRGKHHAIDKDKGKRDGGEAFKPFGATANGNKRGRDRRYEDKDKK
jgi:hypothetical protein